MKRVLVLCQRKSGWVYAGEVANENLYKKIENTVVPQINDLVRSLVGDAFTIEYLSSFLDNDGNSKELLTGAIDIEGFLAKDNSLILNDYAHEKIPVSDFIAQNEGVYDVIVLNTCPYINMDYSLIAQLLAPDGVMVYTVYGASGRKGNIRRLQAIPAKFFTLLESQGDDVLLFTKNNTPASAFRRGGTRAAKKTRTAKKQTKRYTKRGTKRRQKRHILKY